jgi:cell division protein FtsL
MTAPAQRRSTSPEDFRLLRGRRLRRPSIAPWMIMVVIAIVAFLGLVFARTSLDKSAFDLAELTQSIDEQQALNEQLRLEVARLENPARIAPLADDLGLVIPSETNQLLVDLDAPSPMVAGVDGFGASQ